MKPFEKVVLQTNLPLGKVKRGKVRDLYDLGDSLLMIATDRISAFDVILPDGIPGKGAVLTQISLHWFRWMETELNEIAHHIITGDVNQFPKSLHPYREILEERSLLVKKVKPLPVEAIVRGYLSGSGWKEYKNKGTICGQNLPAGLTESVRLPVPIFTPSTKGEMGEHDINISFKTMKQMVGEVAEEVREKSLALYKKAAAYAEKRGLFIADTKMEWGIDPATNGLLLIDELLTPDSSRFWPQEGYQPGRGQASFDKQYVRDYLLSINWSGDTAPPSLPETVIQKTSEKYHEALERLTKARQGAEQEPLSL
jgi:phosphoribosylaminoimidazole-succinocarboxamide synthase